MLALGPRNRVLILIRHIVNLRWSLRGWTQVKVAGDSHKRGRGTFWIVGGDRQKSQLRGRSRGSRDGIEGGGAVDREAQLIDQIRRNCSCPRDISCLITICIGEPRTHWYVAACRCAIDDLEWIVVRSVVENVNARQNIFRRNVVVDTENKLRVADFGHWIRLKKIAGPVWQWQIGINVVLDHRVDWHLIIGIRVARGRICQLNRRQQFAEISRTLGWTQHRQRARVLAFAALGPLIGSKEKQFVFFDRKAEGRSENISAQNRHGLQEVIAGIKRSIAEKFERAAVNLIGSGLDDLIDDAAGSSSILSRVIVSENLEFRNGIGVRIDNNVVAQKIVVVGSVQQERHGFRTLSAYRERIARAIVLIGGKNACLQKPQLQSVTLYQRKLQNTLRGLHFAKRCADGVHLRDIALHLHHLTDRADF